MMHRPDLANRPAGEVLDLDGRKMRHLGAGWFQPAGVEEPMMKRFEIEEPLHRVR